MMSLLKWEAKILNRLYLTQQFNSIIGKYQKVDQIDYKPLFSSPTYLEKEKINQNLNERIIENANTMCKLKTAPSVFLQRLIVNLNQVINQVPYKNEEINQQIFRLQHIVIYSSLSKCRIWPKMLKVSSQLVPNLVQFYNKFTKKFNQDLQFKFDPIILSTKYAKIMHKVNSKRKDHPQLLDAILKNNHPAIHQILKQEGQDILNKVVHGPNQKSCAHIAVEQASLQTIIILWKYGMNYSLLDCQQQTSLFAAIKRADLQIVKFLVQQVKLDVNHKQYQDRTPFYLASFEGNLQLVQYLYQQGANPSQQSKLQRTPLSKACYLGNVQVVKYLIKLGVQLQSVDSKGRTALHNAAWGIQGGRQGKRRGTILLPDSPQSVKLLLDAGHKIDFPDFDGFTPLFSAVSSKAHDSMTILIERGASLNHQTTKKENAAFIAAKYGHLCILKRLVQEYGCDFTKPNYKGYLSVMGTATLDSDECFFYLMHLHFERERKIGVEYLINLTSFVQCLKQFSREDNLRLIKVWVQKEQPFQNESKQKIKEQKQLFLERCFRATNLDILLDEIFSVKSTEEKTIKNMNSTLTSLEKQFLRFILIQPIKRLFVQELRSNNIKMKQLIQRILNHYTKSYNYEPFEQYIQFVLSLKSQINDQIVSINNLQIRSTTPEKDIMQLLQIQTNLIVKSNIQQTLQRIVRFRCTQLLLRLVHSIKSQYSQQSFDKSKRYGINKFSSEQLKALLGVNLKSIKDKTEVDENPQKNLSTLAYCKINGIHDMAAILIKQFNLSEEHFKFKQLQSRHTQKSELGYYALHIPKYSFHSFAYDSQQKQNPTIYAVPDQSFHLTKIFNAMQQEQLQFFNRNRTLKKNIKQVKMFEPMPEKYKVIENQKDLFSAKKSIQKSKLVGIDIEHYSSHNQNFVCLIQISTYSEVFIVDCLKIKNQSICPFLKCIFQDKNIIKVMHSYENDVKWLIEDFEVLNFHNLVDTCKLYVVLNNMYQLAKERQNSDKNVINKSYSLKELGSIFLGYEMSKDFQRADWRVRPLLAQMLQYAAIDAQILLPLYCQMLKQLKNLRQILQRQRKIDASNNSIIGYFKNQRVLKNKGVKHQLLFKESIQNQENQQYAQFTIKRTMI